MTRHDTRGLPSLTCVLVTPSYQVIENTLSITRYWLGSHLVSTPDGLVQLPNWQSR